MDEAQAPGTSTTIDLGGPVHVVDYGGAADGPAVVLVHGLGGSHGNWDLFAPLLTPTARVRALDLPGFGRSEPGERRATVPANVRVLQRFLREVVGEPVVLVGNSMGGMISLFTAAASPDLVHGLVLLDPALPGGRRRRDPALPGGRRRLDPLVAATFALYALPGLGERFLALRRARSAPLTRVRATLEMVGVDPDELPAPVVDRAVTLLEQREDVDGMDRAFLTAARSLLWILLDPRRYRSVMDRVAAPVLLVHGDRDRLVPVSAAREVAAAHPSWRYEELAAVGHVPQLQVPDRLAGLVLSWMDERVSGPAVRS